MDLDQVLDIKLFTKRSWLKDRRRTIKKITEVDFTFVF